MAKPSILLADDDRGTLELYGTFFEKAGWSYELVPDGRSALEAARKRDFDVILTDLYMPGVDGFHVLRELKSAKPQQPVIVVTVAGSVEEVIRTLRDGATDILLKPVDFHQLKEAVARLLPNLKANDAPEKLIYRYVQSTHSLFEIPSGVLAQHKFQLGIIDRLTKAGIVDRNMQLRLQLALQEAITNAIEHGALELPSSWKDEFDNEGVDKFSKMRAERLKDPKYADRKIRIHVSFEHFRLRIAVRDPGPGFLLRDNAPEEQLTGDPQSYGRGLAIIAGTMDEVRYQHRGAELIMVKYLI